ncbi:MAG: RNA polymerase sigma factor [Lentimonas sp.]
MPNSSTSNPPTNQYATSVTLLHRAREGKDDLAWEELMGIYAPFVSKVLASMGFRGADLDDARQMVFIRLWKGLRNYKRDEARAKFRTWFARLIRNTAINIIRSKSREPSGSSLNDDDFGQAPILSDDPVIEARVEQEWQEYIVELAMEKARTKFSGNAIEVFTMSLAGQSVDIIADALNIKTNTVYILKHRVKTVLLNEIQQLKYNLETFDGTEE